MPLTPIDDMLENLRDGKSESLHLNGLVDPITFYEILDSIREAPKVEKLRFAASGFDKDDVAQLLEVTALHPELKELELSDAPIDRKGAVQLVNALSSVKNLRSLKLANCKMDDDAMQPIVEWVAKQEGLRSLELRGNDWSQSTHDRLAWAVRNNTSLTRLDLRPESERKDNHAFETALLHKPHPNFFMSDVKSGPLFKLMGHNHRYMTHTENFIQNKVHGPDRDYATVAARVKPEYLFNAEAHRDVVEYRQQNRPEYMNAYDAFLAQMPRLPEGAAVSLDALLKPDSEGLTPLENPLVWKQHPDLLGKLAAAGELTESTLKRETPRGTSVLEAAFAYRPATETLAALNDKNIRVNQSKLIGEEGEPLKLAELLTMKGEIAALFTSDNWKGADVDAPAKLREAFGKHAQLQTPSLHGLTQQLRLDKRQQNMVGIGR